MSAFMPTAVLALMLAIASPQLPATDEAVSPTGTDSVPSAVVAADQVAPTAAGSPGGLPPRPMAPRTMADFWPVFLFFALTWAGILGYLMAAGRRVRRLGERLGDLEEPR